MLPAARGGCGAISRTTAQTPLGSTIAHGLLTLSLGPRFSYEVFSLEGFAFGLNYGYNRVRFPDPLPVDSRVRMRAVLTKVEEISGGAQITITQTFERDGREQARLRRRAARPGLRRGLDRPRSDAPDALTRPGCLRPRARDHDSCVMTAHAGRRDAPRRPHDVGLQEGDMQTPTVTEISSESYFAARRAWHETPAPLADEPRAGDGRPRSAPAG